MSDIIKTIEAWRDPDRVRRFLGVYRKDTTGHAYVFQLGRGEPKRKPVERLWFVFRGEVYGHFRIAGIERNAGQFDQWFETMFGDGYQLRPDNWLAVCRPPFHFMRPGFRPADEPPVYHDGFQGWRYFDLESYRQRPEAMFAV